MIKYFRYVIHEHKSIATVAILLCYLSYLLRYPDSFTLGVIASLVTSVLLYLITGNFFFSLFSVYSLALPFRVPAKQYHFLFASPQEYQYEPLPDGIFDNSYFTISTVWGTLLALFYVNRIFHYIFFKKSTATTTFVSVLRKPLVFLTLSSWSIYFFLSFFSSLFFSFNPSYSLNYLLHEGNIAIAYIGMLYLFLVQKEGEYYFFLILISNITFYGIIGASQILHLFTEQSYVHSLPIVDAEQRILFRRINGVFGPNGHAYLITIFSIMFLPLTRAIRGKTPLFLVVLLAIVNIIFSQSRTVWLGVCIIILLLFVFNRNSVLLIFTIVRRKIKPLHAILFILSLLIVVIPRISVSGLFFSEEGGGALRTQMLNEGLQLLHQSPWFGFGAGTTVRAFLDHFQNSYIREFPFPIHITYLQLALETGIPATIAFFVPYYLLVRHIITLKSKNKWKKGILTSSFSCVILTLVYFSFQPTFGRTEFGYSGIILGLGAAALAKVDRHNI